MSALAEHHRVIAVDLPGFGDSVMPLGAAYDAQFFARSVLALMDAMGLERATWRATAWAAEWPSRRP